VARAAAAVTHPNLAAIYEVSEAEGVAFIAMELVEGTTLRARLQAGAIPEGEALRIAHEIARGLARAHREGIVHRDLKPDNVIVGADGLVKILDFGIARPLDGVDESISGTPAYMPPEQRSGGKLDSRIDVFAFGVLLFELVTGALPREAHGATRTKRLEAVRADVRALVESCLHEDPARRPENGAALESRMIALRERAPRRRARTAALWTIAFATIGAAVAAGRSCGGGSLPRIAPPAASNAGLPSAGSLEMPRPHPLKRLTANVPENNVVHAALSPDGASLATIDKGGLAIGKLGSASSRRIPLEKGLSPELVAWTPDGRSVVVTAAKSGDDTRQLFIASVDDEATDDAGDRLQLVTEGDFAGVAVSPDGSKIAYAESDRVGWIPFPKKGAPMIAAASRKPLLTRSGGCFLSEVAWSPDARRIGFTSRCCDSLASTTVETVATEGGEPVVAVRDARLFNDNAPMASSSIRAPNGSPPRRERTCGASASTRRPELPSRLRGSARIGSAPAPAR
jgi:hypothetical protein